MPTEPKFDINSLYDELHVWYASLTAPTTDIGSLRKILSPDELRRATRYKRIAYTHKFIVARAVLRILIGNYLRMSPSQIEFHYSKFGKPYLKTSSQLGFNLAHSGDLAVYAFTSPMREVGIDVEFSQTDMDFRRIAKHFFSSNEVLSLNEADDDEIPKLFYRYWTRKEAFIKAYGMGLYYPLTQVDLSPMELRKDGADKAYAYRDHNQKVWYITDLEFDCNYVGALAIASKVAPIRIWMNARQVVDTYL